MNLHYSQTLACRLLFEYGFYYLMNLHYSQTLRRAVLRQNYVLLPYEFTLLSNSAVQPLPNPLVLLPYEFTLLSNSVNVKA